MRMNVPARNSPSGRLKAWLTSLGEIVLALADEVSAWLVVLAKVEKQQRETKMETQS